MHYYRRIIVVSLSVLLLATVWFLNPATDSSPGSANTAIVPADQAEPDFESRPQRNRSNSAATNQAEQREQQSGTPNEPVHATAIEALAEIGLRISEEQYDEAENELEAFVSVINQYSTEEKFAFLDSFLRQAEKLILNPETFVAFDQFWSMLDLEQEDKTRAARLLAPFYSENYEFGFAINQYELILAATGDLDSDERKELANAYFWLHDYDSAIDQLLEHFEIQNNNNEIIERREYSQLFESYLRNGDYASAEIVGQLILQTFNDLQDWKDMELFYQESGNEQGHREHLSRAQELGFLQEDGEWINQAL